MRTIRLGKDSNISGAATFSIVFLPGKTESIEYVSGQESLKSLIDRLKAAHYEVEFPTSNKAQISRRLEVDCTPLSGCIGVLVTPDRTGVGSY